MPRLSAVRLSMLEDLASQLRYAPIGRTLEQIKQIITLAPQLEVDQLYPEDWLIQRLTGYRPEIDEPAMIVGGALLANLSAFTERLSDQGNLTNDSLIDPVLTLDELTARWSVSARTIERRRRVGLIALRVQAGGQSRLVFPVESIEAYERMNTPAIVAAARRSRIEPDDRQRIIDQAKRAQGRFGWTLNEAAKRLATKHGRSHEAIRQILLKAGGGQTAMSQGDRRRTAMVRAADAGWGTKRLAEKYKKSPASVRRILNEKRSAILRESLATLEVLRGRPERFDLPEEREQRRVLEAPAAREGLGSPIAHNAGEFVAQARQAPPPERSAERAMALAMLSLLQRADQAAGPLGASAPRASAIDSAQTDLRWATLLAAKLIRSQCGFVLNAIEARIDRPLLELPAALIWSVHRSAFDAAIGAAWRFDSARGGRLATPTGLAVDRALARWLNQHGSELPGDGMRARAVGASVVDWTGRLGVWQKWLDPSELLVGRLDQLAPVARQVVGLRHGFLDEPPMTRRAVAERLGVSERRVTAIEREAQATAGGGAPDRADLDDTE